MDAFSSPYLWPAFCGFASGILLCIPVGPVNLTIMNEAARRGFTVAMVISAGAVLMEMIYCTIAFTGFASIFDNKMVKAAMELTSFVFMLYLGVRFLTARAIQTTSKVEERIEQKLHPHSAFMIGFVRVMGNPGVLLFWIILAANFLSRDWVEPTWPSKLTLVAGVGAGNMVWFFGLSYIVGLKHGKLSERTLLRMEHFSGIGLLGLAVAHGAHIVWQMVHHTL